MFKCGDYNGVKASKKLKLFLIILSIQEDEDNFKIVNHPVHPKITDFQKIDLICKGKTRKIILFNPCRAYSLFSKFDIFSSAPSLSIDFLRGDQSIQLFANLTVSWFDHDPQLIGPHPQVNLPTTHNSHFNQILINVIIRLWNKEFFIYSVFMCVCICIVRVRQRERETMTMFYLLE